MLDFPLDLMARTYTYNTDGTIATDTATHPNGNVWVKTYSYTAGRLTSETGWVKQ